MPIIIKNQKSKLEGTPERKKVTFGEQQYVFSTKIPHLGGGVRKGSKGKLMMLGGGIKSKRGALTH